MVDTNVSEVTICRKSRARHQLGALPPDRALRLYHTCSEHYRDPAIVLRHWVILLTSNSRNVSVY